jgi:hypothetical protein
MLKARAERMGLSHRVEWRGALAQPKVLAAYRGADLFVLASKVAEDGDRDGLPNVLVEAQSQRLACISTNVSGIPELIEDGVTGLLIPPGDPFALAEALASLIRDPATRAELGAAGELRVRSRFSIGPGIDVLAERFGLDPPREGNGPASLPLLVRLASVLNVEPGYPMACASPSTRVEAPDHPFLGRPAGSAAVSCGLTARRARRLVASRFRSYGGMAV